MSSYNITILQADAFNIFILISYATYFLLLLGIISKEPSYISTLDFYAKIYVCAFLLYRFNPLRKKVACNYLDRKIVFTSGIFLLTISISNSLAIGYINKTKLQITKAVEKIKNKITDSPPVQTQPTIS
jgi:uncharacterized membrane protein (DUF441 family)